MYDAITRIFALGAVYVERANYLAGGRRVLRKVETNLLIYLTENLESTPMRS
jgi:hypothetical protein